MTNNRTLWWRFVAPIIGVTGLVLGVVALLQARVERRSSLDNLERRGRAVTLALVPLAEEALGQRRINPTVLANRFDGKSRTQGVLLCRTDGTVIALSPAVKDIASCDSPVLAAPRLRGTDTTAVLGAPGAKSQVLAVPIRGDSGEVRGVLAVFHDASFIDSQVLARITYAALVLAVLALLISITTLGSAYSVFGRSLNALASWMQRLRLDEKLEDPPPAIPLRSLAMESERLGASFKAARSSARTLARRVTDADQQWTSERLRHHVMDALNGAQLVVVSNREPYFHFREQGELKWLIPASGLVTALDPVLRACGGLWVANGAGDADRDTADQDGRLVVPPGETRYTLRRIWITREEEQGYYYGLSNEGMWPLCHAVHERPEFRPEDWSRYVEVNERFAKAVLDEVGSAPALVLVQDYHLALLPKLLRQSRPDLAIGLFWHIPWPAPEAFRAFPWKAETLDGMLGADVVGFHLQQHCNNFLDTVDRMLEVRVDLDEFGVWQGPRMTHVRPFPISVQPWEERDVPRDEALDRVIQHLRSVYKLDGKKIAIGVDRIDYTKGIPERIRAVSRFLDDHPDWIGRFVFVQLGAPSRVHLARYRDLVTEVEALADEVNWRFQREDWKPIVILKAHHTPAAVYTWMRMADICVVSSLADGMNLVAKEYVSARTDGDGALVLSEFAGAARELSDAFIVNPYDVGQAASALHRALEMSVEERRARMARMREQVARFNVYRWARDLIGWTARAHGGRRHGSQAAEPEATTAG
jgi:trehalose 6-phosphate synthase